MKFLAVLGTLCLLVLLILGIWWLIDNISISKKQKDTPPDTKPTPPNMPSAGLTIVKSYGQDTY